MSEGLPQPPRRVLVVDGDVLGARALARLLRDDGYDVEVAVDGAAGVARLSIDPPPDVVVTELTLPHANGLALARYARARSPEVVIVFATSAPHRLRDHGLLPVPQVRAKPLDYSSLREGLPPPARALPPCSLAAAAGAPLSIPRLGEP